VGFFFFEVSALGIFICLFFSHLCFCIEICSCEVRSLLGGFNHYKFFQLHIFYVLAELGSSRVDVLFVHYLPGEQLCNSSFTIQNQTRYLHETKKLRRHICPNCIIDERDWGSHMTHKLGFKN
jgi:hypothetical protein